jgi:RimJ/RimL family protein N-acetyltransferase
LLRRCWRQGFASEGCRELLRHAFEDLSLHRVFGVTMTANGASRATMAAIGMRHLRTFHADDEGPAGIELGEVEYEITRDEWVARTSVDHSPTGTPAES